jgi:hypothetical protein
MNSALFLAADFLERASNPSYGPEINEEYALRWVTLRETGDPVKGLNLAELGRSDLDALSPQAWLWLASSLEDQDPEFPISFAESLFTTSTDPVIRLAVADSMLRHPHLARRYSEAGETLISQPPNWARDRLLSLLEKDDQGNGLTEMTLILLQVGNKPALTLLRGLRRQRREAVDPIVNELAKRINENPSALLRRLGLSDDE